MLVEKQELLETLTKTQEKVDNQSIEKPPF